MLDPSDLIAVFSDGIDDDGNGYIDDISGWDFFSGDNNPLAQLLDGYASHGTGVAEEAAEAAASEKAIAAAKAATEKADQELETATEAASGSTSRRRTRRGSTRR